MQTELRPKPNYFWKIVAKRGQAVWLKLKAKPNATQIRPFLWLGAAYSQSQFSVLHRQGIRAVADLREEAPRLPFMSAYSGLHLRRFPVEDRKAHGQEALLQIVRWVLAQTEQHCHTLVHCQHGIGRAPLAVACVLLTEGLEPAQALKEVEGRRWQVRMNGRQLQALKEFSTTWERFLQREKAPLPPGGV